MGNFTITLDNNINIGTFLFLRRTKIFIEKLLFWRSKVCNRGKYTKSVHSWKNRSFHHCTVEI